jgi:hypothetical protein
MRTRWHDLPFWRRAAVVIVALVGGVYILLFAAVMILTVAKF